MTCSFVEERAKHINHTVHKLDNDRLEYQEARKKGRHSSKAYQPHRAQTSGRGIMACGRESRSAVAAAVSAWRLRPLVLMLMLLLFSVMPHGALSRGLGLPPEPTIKRNMTCNSIPYPFGVRGRSIPGFEVTCGPSQEAMLPIGKHSYEIHDVSLQGGFVVIFAGPISKVCYDRNGTQTQTTGIGDITLKQTPFSNGAGGDHLMILDWEVGRGTCAEASTSNLGRLYCNNMSGCIDAPSRAGYLCSRWAFGLTRKFGSGNSGKK